MSDEDWEFFAKVIRACNEESEPRDLLNESIVYEPKKKTAKGYEVDPRLDKMYVQCVTSVTLVNITTLILQGFYDILAPKTIQDLLTNHLERSYKFAHDFNS